MRILFTGATGYIAQRLLPILLGNGNEVVCCVRDKERFNSEKYASASLSVIEVDFLKAETLQNIPLISMLPITLFTQCRLQQETLRKWRKSPPSILEIVFNKPKPVR